MTAEKQGDIASSCLAMLVKRSAFICRTAPCHQRDTKAYLPRGAQCSASTRGTSAPAPAQAVYDCLPRFPQVKQEGVVFASFAELGKCSAFPCKTASPCQQRDMKASLPRVTMLGQHGRSTAPAPVQIAHGCLPRLPHHEGHLRHKTWAN